MAQSQSGQGQSRTTITEHLLKVLVVGDMGTGKTSIISRYVYDCFSDQYKSTIGVDFAMKTFQWDSENIVRMQLWDIAGQERFGNMTRVYYKEASAAFIVFDVNRATSWNAVINWKNDIDSKVTKGPENLPIPVFLLANKCDVAEWQKSYCVTTEELDKFVADNNFVGWKPTSAKFGLGIDEASRQLLEVVLRDSPKVVETPATVSLATQPPPKKKCCLA